MRAVRVVLRGHSFAHRQETPKGRKDLIALTEVEIDRLANVARKIHGDYGDEMTAIILGVAYTGVRPGELAALRWPDLDPANRQAVISRSDPGLANHLVRDLHRFAVGIVQIDPGQLDQLIVRSTQLV